MNRVLFIVFALSTVIAVPDALSQQVTLTVCRKDRENEALYHRSFDSFTSVLNDTRKFGAERQRAIIADEGKYYLEHAVVLDQRDNGKNFLADSQLRYNGAEKITFENGSVAEYLGIAPLELSAGR